MTIGGRIRQLRGDVGQQEFADLFKLSKRSLSHYENDNRSPKIDLLISIAQKFSVEIQWLVEGKESTKVLAVGGVEAPKPLGSNKCCNCEDLFFVPRVRARLSAGHGSLLTEGEIVAKYSFHSKWLHSIGQPSKMVILFIDGNSMQPEVCDNDMVMIDQSQDDLRPGKIYAVGVDDTILVKYVDVEPGAVILRSKNQEYPPIRVTKDQKDSIRILGRVIWSARVY